MTSPKSNKAPIVSVIMPAYNSAGTIKEAVNSVIRQTFNNFELIICNDASTDKTVSILEEISDSRIKVLHNEKNLGEGLSRDKAIKNAKGDWLSVIDADDAWVPERLETLLLAADKLSNGLIFDDIIECHDTGTGMKPWQKMRGKYAFGGNGFDAMDVPIENFIRSTRLLIKPLFPRCYVEQYGITHTTRKFGADTEFFLRLLAHDMKLRYVPKAMYQYRITPGSMTGQKNRMALMQEVLENAMHQFSDSPSIQSSLRYKIAKVKRDEQYMPFIWTIKEKKIRDAFLFASKNPWLILEFLSRAVKSLPYHIHRLWHGGKTRGIQ